jgi:hypothetical protein
MCPQLSPLNGGFVGGSDEDCLTLNVWSPAEPSETARPVMVWIHGGGFVLGSGGDAAYDGQALSEATGHVVVTLNYRLGPLGFLAHPDLKAEDPAHPSSGNYGLEDQRAALEWVQANIAGFGGDPGSVTIFGESAGGASVCHHLVSPGSAGLFHAAVLQSGPCDLVVEEAEAFASADALAVAVACDADDPLACLRDASPAELLTALPAPSFGVGTAGTSWYPVIDGEVLPSRPSDMLEAGDAVSVPVILGSNADEATMFFQLGGSTVEDEAGFLALAEQAAPGEGDAILAQYPVADYGSYQTAAVAAFSDAGFICPTRRAARGTVVRWQPHLPLPFHLRPHFAVRRPGRLPLGRDQVRPHDAGSALASTADRRRANARPGDERLLVEARQRRPQWGRLARVARLRRGDRPAHRLRPHPLDRRPPARSTVRLLGRDGAVLSSPMSELSIGRAAPLEGVPGAPASHTPIVLPTHHLVTHGVILGMTGSGKTGLSIVMIEEALRAGVPVLAVDIKGDLPNLLLTFPELDGPSFAPWVDPEAAARAGRSVDDIASETATRWRAQLATWGLGPEQVRALREGTAARLVTPGASIGEPLDVLSSLSTRSPLWDDDPEAAHDQLSSAISLVLRLAGADGDPRSREHVVLSTLALRRLEAASSARLEELLKRPARAAHRPRRRDELRAVLAPARAWRTSMMTSARWCWVCSVEEVLSWVAHAAWQPALKPGGVRRGLRLLCRPTPRTRPPSAPASR